MSLDSWFDKATWLWDSKENFLSHEFESIYLLGFCGIYFLVFGILYWSRTLSVKLKRKYQRAKEQNQKILNFPYDKLDIARLCFHLLLIISIVGYNAIYYPTFIFDTDKKDFREHLDPDVDQIDKTNDYNHGDYTYQTFRQNTWIISYILAGLAFVLNIVLTHLEIICGQQESNIIRIFWFLMLGTYCCIFRTFLSDIYYKTDAFAKDDGYNFDIDDIIMCATLFLVFGDFTLSALFNAERGAYKLMMDGKRKEDSKQQKKKQDSATKWW